MRALLALPTLLLAGAVFWTPSPGDTATTVLATPTPPQEAALQAPAEPLGFRDTSSDASLLVTTVEPVSLGLFVPQSHQVVLQFELSDSAYAGFNVNGPGLCQDSATAGAGASPATPAMQIILQCGVLATGWYTVQVTVDAGLARGVVESAGAYIFSTQE